MALVELLHTDVSVLELHEASSSTLFKVSPDHVSEIEFSSNRRGRSRTELASTRDVSCSCTLFVDG